VFLDLPAAGLRVESGEQCGEIESTKSVAPLFAPMSGVVESVNQEVLDNPELVNQDPFGAGWLYEFVVDGWEACPQPAAVELLDAEDYAELVAGD
jgi:glycine cleavage system H protein